ARGGYVALERVVHHHPVGVKSPSEGADGALHALDPAVRQAVAVTLVVKRNNLFPKHPIQVLAVAGVVQTQVGMGPARADGESIQAVIGLRPPAVQNREVEAAVQNDFLTASSG